VGLSIHNCFLDSPLHGYRIVFGFPTSARAEMPFSKADGPSSPVPLALTRTKRTLHSELLFVVRTLFSHKARKTSPRVLLAPQGRCFSAEYIPNFFLFPPFSEVKSRGEFNCLYLFCRYFTPGVNPSDRQSNHTFVLPDAMDAYSSFSPLRPYALPVYLRVSFPKRTQ